MLIDVRDTKYVHRADLSVNGITVLSGDVCSFGNVLKGMLQALTDDWIFLRGDSIVDSSSDKFIEVSIGKEFKCDRNPKVCQIVRGAFGNSPDAYRRITLKEVLCNDPERFDPESNTVYVLENPEQGYRLSRYQGIADALVDLAYSEDIDPEFKFIITTNSPYFVRCFAESLKRYSLGGDSFHWVEVEGSRYLVTCESAEKVLDLLNQDMEAVSVEVRENSNDQ